MLRICRKTPNLIERLPGRWLIVPVTFVIVLATFILSSSISTRQVTISKKTSTSITVSKQTSNKSKQTSNKITVSKPISNKITVTKHTSDKRCNDWFAETFSENLQVISKYKRGNADLYWQHINGNLTEPSKWMTSFPVIVSASDNGYYPILQGLLKSVHEVLLPKYKDLKMIVYDLGFSEEQLQKMKIFCKCEVRQFPFHLFPDYIRRLKSYAWKPLIVKTVLMEYGWVWWMDSSIRMITENLEDALQYSKDNSVLFFNNPVSNNIAYHTDSATLKYLGEDVCKFRYFGEVEANFNLYYFNNVTDIIVSQWAACALNKECMVPDGTEQKIFCDFGKKYDGRCHRYDQSILSILLRRLFHEERNYPLKPLKIYDIRRGERVNYF